MQDLHSPLPRKSSSPTRNPSIGGSAGVVGMPNFPAGRYKSFGAPSGKGEMYS